MIGVNGAHPGTVLEVGKLGEFINKQNRSGRNLIFQKLLLGLIPVDVPEPSGGQGVRLDQHIQSVPAAHLFENGVFVDQPSELREVSLNAHADPIPEPVGLAADHHVSVPAGIPLILVQVGVPGAGPGLDAGVKTVPADIKVKDVHSGSLHR